MNFPKRQPIRSKAITQAADGEACSICDRRDGTVVFSHLDESFAGKGMGQKADDIAGFFACYSCHEAYGRKLKTVTHWMVMRAMYKTWRRLIERGVITIEDFDPSA